MTGDEGYGTPMKKRAKPKARVGPSPEESDECFGDEWRRWSLPETPGQPAMFDDGKWRDRVLTWIICGRAKV